MAPPQTWQGWEADLLGPLNAPTTAKNRTWLEEWAQAEPHGCAHNPLGASLPAPGASRCAPHPGGGSIYAYQSPRLGASATVAQLHEAAYASILAALRSGDPFSYSAWQLVVGALGVWGAHTFAKRYTDAMSPKVASGPHAPSPRHALEGWQHANRTLAHDLPSSLARSARLRRDALRRLRQAGRLR